MVLLVLVLVLVFFVVFLWLWFSFFWVGRLLCSCFCFAVGAGDATTAAVDFACCLAGWVLYLFCVFFFLLSGVHVIFFVLCWSCVTLKQVNAMQGNARQTAVEAKSKQVKRAVSRSQVAASRKK